MIIVTKNFVWWNPAHYTDHELWVATFTDDQTARSRWPSSPLHFTTGSITAAEIKWSSIKLPDRELQLDYISSGCDCYDYEFAP